MVTGRTMGRKWLAMSRIRDRSWVSNEYEDVYWNLFMRRTGHEFDSSHVHGKQSGFEGE